MTNNALARRLALAIENDNNIVVERSRLHEAKGVSLDYMQFIGLRKADLKALESKGIAIYGRVKIKVGNIYPGHKTEARWIIVGADKEGNKDG